MSCNFKISSFLTLSWGGVGKFTHPPVNRPLSVEKANILQNVTHLMHKKIPPLTPTPHPKPWFLSYLCISLPQSLWCVTIASFHSMSLYASVRTKKLQNTPPRIGLSEEPLCFNPILGGGWVNLPTLSKSAFIGRKSEYFTKCYTSHA